MSKKKKVAVIAPMRTLDHQPGIINAVRCFVDGGYDVDLYTVKAGIYDAPDIEGVQVRYLPLMRGGILDNRIVMTLAFSIWMSWARRRRYFVIFAGGIRGVVAAWLSSWWRPARIINLQLELYVGVRLDTWLFQRLKWMERRAVQYSWLSLIHDERRAAMLCEDLGVSRQKLMVVPNAPLGPSRQCISDFLSKRLSIPNERKILLAPGTVSEAFSSYEIVNAAQLLPESWVCVIHSAQPLSKNDSVVARLSGLDKGNRVEFSLDPVSYSDLYKVLGSARIGLALYSESGGENTTAVGLASGKLCEFLRLGVPVIVSDLPVLGDFVRETNSGVALGDLTQLPEAVHQIELDYEAYRRRAAAAFDEHLAFEKHFTKVLRRLESAESLNFG